MLRAATKKECPVPCDPTLYRLKLMLSAGEDDAEIVKVDGSDAVENEVAAVVEDDAG